LSGFQFQLSSLPGALLMFKLALQTIDVVANQPESLPNL